jgi:hypothetical protein
VWKLLIVQFAFSKDIHLKGSQSLWNLRSRHIGVIFTQRCQCNHCDVCSRFRFPHKKSSASDRLQRYFTKLVAQRCHWYRCVINFSSRIRSYFRKDFIFNPCIRGPVEVVWWKNAKVENLVAGSLWSFLFNCSTVQALNLEKRKKTLENKFYSNY